MPYTNQMPDFPFKIRGSYRIVPDEEESQGQRMVAAKERIKSIAEANKITILLYCEMRGNGWSLRWWPASEPRHEITDEIIN